MTDLRSWNPSFSTDLSWSCTKGATVTGEKLLEPNELQHQWTLANHHRTKHRIATERGREKERAIEGKERCKREWVDGGKAWLMLPQTLGAGFARSARPEKQKRCHYREERISVEERTEGGERECQKGRLTLSSFFYTRTQFLPPAESARAAVGPQV